MASIHTPEQGKYVSERWAQLNGLLLETIKDSINFLFIVNGGGCAAVLAYLAQALHPKYAMYFVLFFFFLGLLFVGVLNIRRYQQFSNLILKWTENSKKFYTSNDEMSFQELNKLDELEVKKGRRIEYWGYASFLCIVIAGAIGFVGMTGIRICFSL